MSAHGRGYLLGLDNGSTAIKAGVFDFEGREVATAVGGAEVSTPRPGWYERDMDDIWRANVTAIRAVLEKSGISGDRVCAIGVAGHGNGLHLVDGGGAPLYRAIEGADVRAEEYVRRWQRDGTWERLLPKIAQQLWAAQPPALLAWMRDHEAGVLRSARWMFMVKDYVRFRLTGEAFAEVTDMSGTSLFNVRDVRYDDEILAAYGLEELSQLLPPLRGSSEICGRVSAEAARATGVPAGTPVAGGLFDIDAAAVATGLTDPRNMNVIVGTWCNNQYVSPEPVISKDLFMTSVFCVPGHWLILEGSATSASNLDWFLGEFSTAADGASAHAECDAAVASVDPGDPPVVFLPFLYQSNAGPDARSAFVGMRGYHSRSHMIRAIYEGIAFSHRSHIEKLLRFRGRPEAIRIAGGATRSAVWVQMFADVLGTPIEVTEGSELGAMGAAMCAGVATGVFASFPDAARKTVRVARRVEPDANNAGIYDRKYQRYRRVIEALSPAWGAFTEP